MKAIVLTDHFGEGGAERVASLLIKGLADVGHEVHVCVFIDSNNYNLDLSKVNLHLLSTQNHSHALNILIRMRNLIKTIKEIKPDVIYSFGPSMASYVVIASSLCGFKKKIKVISSERNDPRREPASKWMKTVRDFCYRRSDVVVCQTQMAVDLLKSRNINTKFVIIPNPISPNLPSWEGKSSKEIITACRLTEQKNLPMLIGAFARLKKEFPDYHLTIYGEGHLRQNLQTYIESMGLKESISMPGFAKNIHQIMATSYMYVSSSDYEGISNSMLEALGIGLPCVCTDCPVGGAAMYIENGKSGILTKVGDEDELFEGMKKYIVDKETVRNVSRCSIEIRDRLSFEKITKNWVEL